MSFPNTLNVAEMNGNTDGGLPRISYICASPYPFSYTHWEEHYVPYLLDTALAVYAFLRRPDVGIIINNVSGVRNVTALIIVTVYNTVYPVYIDYYNMVVCIPRFGTNRAFRITFWTVMHSFVCSVSRWLPNPTDGWIRI